MSSCFSNFVLSLELYSVHLVFLPEETDLSSLSGLGSALGEGLVGLGMDDIDLHLKLLSMLDNPAVIVAAAAAGKADVIKEYLTRRPKDVCTLMCACIK